MEIISLMAWSNPAILPICLVPVAAVSQVAQDAFLKIILKVLVLRAAATCNQQAQHLWASQHCCEMALNQSLQQRDALWREYRKNDWSL